MRTIRVRYHVSFVWIRGSEHGTGYSVFAVNRQIITMMTLNKIVDFIKRGDSFDSVSIISLTKMNKSN